MKVLMVCLGNICRSPLAEGILKHKAYKAGLEWQVDSAGIGGWHAGELPDRRSIAVAKQYGIDITDQRARQIRESDLDEFDLILVMDRDNQKDVTGLAKTEAHRQKIHLIMNLARPNRNDIVPDPYYNNRFEQTYQLLDEACEAVLRYEV